MVNHFVFDHFVGLALKGLKVDNLSGGIFASDSLNRSITLVFFLYPLTGRFLMF